MTLTIDLTSLAIGFVAGMGGFGLFFAFIVTRVS
jgi:hypothetical protein